MYIDHNRGHVLHNYAAQDGGLLNSFKKKKKKKKKPNTNNQVSPQPCSALIEPSKATLQVNVLLHTIAQRYFHMLQL